jgi:hypothetical protein
VNEAATAMSAVNRPSGPGSTQVCATWSHAAVPARHTDSSAGDCCKAPKPAPVTVTTASSGRSVAGVTVIDGGGGSGASGSKRSRTRPARDESGR